MIPKELFQQIRRIEITTSRLVKDVFAGAYHSVFKGRGMEFDEVREYILGDDIRTIDWNVTARTGVPHVKKYVEERELTVLILVDASASCRFGSVRTLKSKLAAELAAVLAFAAIRNNDKVGLLIFTDEVEELIPPRKGLRHVLRIIREILYFEPKGTGTNLQGALEYLHRVSSRRAVVFVISDFILDDSTGNRHRKSGNIEGLRKALAIANKRHDLVAVTLNDPREEALSDSGLIELEDAETGEILLVDSGDEGLRARFMTQARDRLKERTRLFLSAGMDHIDISTGVPFSDELVKFFMRRKKRFR